MGDLQKAICQCHSMSEQEFVNAEKKNYFTTMGSGRVFVHVIMTLVTAGMWLGWMGMGWFQYGTKFFCTECGVEVPKSNIRL
jgi:hypothetical protein